MTFKDKVAVITGGGTGIGKAAVSALISEGAKVVINGRREDVLAAALRSIDPTGASSAYLAGDIGQPETSEKLVALAESRFGGVDILLNNAGVFAPKPFLDHSEEDFDHYVSIILKGSFFAAQAAARSMKRKGGGAIVQTGSMWALQAVGATPSSAYSVAKAGAHQLVKNLAIELSAHQIRVNAVAPAVVETPVYGTFLQDDQVKAVLDSFNGFHPLGRIGQPADVVSAILFLASDAASWITGTVLPVDGGVMAGRSA
jgi:NAD(P)-dependent dehydrogenase (short-subunit alcohol dehydrogenase family)